jgi:hypothetical protein
MVPFVAWRAAGSWLICGILMSGMPVDHVGVAAATNDVMGRVSRILVSERRMMRETTIVRFNYELSWDPGFLSRNSLSELDNCFTAYKISLRGDCLGYSLSSLVILVQPWIELAIRGV